MARSRHPKKLYLPSRLIYFAFLRKSKQVRSILIPASPQILSLFSGSQTATIKLDKEFTAMFNGWTKAPLEEPQYMNGPNNELTNDMENRKIILVKPKSASTPAKFALRP